MSLFTAAQIEQANQGKLVDALLLEFRFASETVRAWNGNVDRKFAGVTWRGLRGLIQDPAIPFQRGGENATATMIIRGMPERIEELIWDEVAEVHGRLIVSYCQWLSVYRERGQQAMAPIGDPVGMQIYVMRGVKSVEVGATEPGGPMSYDLSLLIELLTAPRSEASFGRFSPADQAARYPEVEDHLFDDVPNLARGQTTKLF